MREGGREGGRKKVVRISSIQTCTMTSDPIKHSNGTVSEGAAYVQGH